MDFPLKENQSYLDSAASSLTPEPVLAAMDAYYRECRANVHRGMYAAAEEATKRFEEARGSVATFINASPDEVVFTKGATEALNIVANGLCQGLKEGDEIVLSVMEHHANLVPWQQFAKWKGAVIKWIGLTPEMTLDMEEAKRLIGPKTKIVSVTQASNVLGAVNDVKALAVLAHEFDAVMVVDAAQSAPHMKIDVKDLGCDFLAFSSHKMLGPTGVGALYGKKSRLEALPPMQFGGDMVLEVTKDGATWNEVPARFEAGTPNIAGAIGFGAAAEYLMALGMDSVASRERVLTAYAMAKLSAIEGLKIYGPKERLGVISFSLEGAHPHDVATILAREGVAVRGGHHCTMPLHALLGTPATNRASFSVYTTTADIDRLAAAIGKVKEIFA